MTKEEILKKHLNVMLVEHSNDYNTVEVMSEQSEYKIILEAMEEYALQQVKNSGIITPVIECSHSGDSGYYEITGELRCHKCKKVFLFSITSQILNGGT